MVYAQTKDIQDLFSSQIILDVLHDHAHKYREQWLKILKQNPVEHDVRKIINCSFDCIDVQCQNEHSEDPRFYKAQWLKRLRQELGIQIKPFKDELEEIEKELERHETLREEIEKEEKILKIKEYC